MLLTLNSVTHLDSALNSRLQFVMPTYSKFPLGQARLIHMPKTKSCFFPTKSAPPLYFPLSVKGNAILPIAQTKNLKSPVTSLSSDLSQKINPVGFTFKIRPTYDSFYHYHSIITSHLHH